MSGTSTRTVLTVGLRELCLSNGRDEMPVILVAEDEPAISETLVARLRGEGFETLQAFDGPSAVEQCLQEIPDLMILDLNLPGFDGLEVCRQVHAVRRTPVIMVTARADETDMLIGLGMGADDYITKPFSMRELMARLRVVLRRSQLGPNGEQDLIQTAALKIDPARRTALHLGSPVHLTPTEFDLLRTLAEAEGAVFTREQSTLR